MTTFDAPLVATVKHLLDPLIIIGSLLILANSYGEPFNGLYLILAILTFFISSQVYEAINLFRTWRIGNLLQHANNVFTGWIIVVAILAFLGNTTGLYADFSQKVVITWIIICPFSILLVHHVIRKIVTRVKSDSMVRSVIIVGANELGINLAHQVMKDPYLFMKLKGYFEDRAPSRCPHHPPAPILGKLTELPDYVRRNQTRLIFVCLPISAQTRIRSLVDDVRDSTASVYFVPDIYTFDLIQARFDTLNGIPVVSICETPFLGIDSVLKRVSDVVLASLFVLILLPIMTIISIAVWISSPGPVIFKQRRYGLNGEQIVVYKFRSMTVCEDGLDVPQAKLGDHRVTRIGMFLRKYSLDELPQFINVLQGRMSIVGPRPHAVVHNELYRKQIKGYMLRHKVRPGITGWAQINGLRGETDTIDKMNARIKFDLDYLRNWSPLLDIWIILRTAWIVLRGDNAH